MEIDPRPLFVFIGMFKPDDPGDNVPATVWLKHGFSIPVTVIDANCRLAIPVAAVTDPVMLLLVTPIQDIGLGDLIAWFDLRDNPSGSGVTQQIRRI